MTARASRRRIYLMFSTVSTAVIRRAAGIPEGLVWDSLSARQLSRAGRDRSILRASLELEPAWWCASLFPRCLQLRLRWLCEIEGERDWRSNDYEVPPYPDTGHGP